MGLGHEGVLLRTRRGNPSRGLRDPSGRLLGVVLELSTGHLWYPARASHARTAQLASAAVGALTVCCGLSGGPCPCSTQILPRRNFFRSLFVELICRNLVLVCDVCTFGHFAGSDVAAGWTIRRAARRLLAAFPVRQVLCTLNGQYRLRRFAFRFACVSCRCCAGVCQLLLQHTVSPWFPSLK